MLLVEAVWDMLGGNGGATTTGGRVATGAVAAARGISDGVV